MTRKTRGRTTAKFTRAARELRQKPTPAEAKLWEALRGRRLAGLKFRRQHPYGGFILDAFCVKHQLEVEVDGGIHTRPEQLAHDAARQEFLEARGIRVLRFSNEEVEHDFTNVLERIVEAIMASPPTPSSVRCPSEQERRSEHIRPDRSPSPDGALGFRHQERGSGGEAHPWFVSPCPNPGASLRLFCFPHAGGGAPVFAAWPDGLPASVEVLAAVLPGRGARLREAPIARLSSLIEAILPSLRTRLDKPFAFFGHSLGALVVFELARELCRRGIPAPVALFVSGRGAPHLRETQSPIHGLPEPEFLEGLRRLGGTPAELLENRELMTLLMPALRADLALAETHANADGPPLDCPIEAMGGRADPRVTRTSLERWQDLTRGPFSLHTFPGDHFFLNTARASVLEVIARRLGTLGSKFRFERT